jgi:hypothetical protein
MHPAADHAGEMTLALSSGATAQRHRSRRIWAVIQHVEYDGEGAIGHALRRGEYPWVSVRPRGCSRTPARAAVARWWSGARLGSGKRRCWSTPRSARTGCWCCVRRASTPSPTSRSPGFMGWCARCSPSSDNCSSRRRRRSPARSGSRRRPIRIDCLCRRRHVGQRLVLREYQLRPLLPRGSLQARGEPQSSPVVRCMAGATDTGPARLVARWFVSATAKGGSASPGATISAPSASSDRQRVAAW